MSDSEPDLLWLASHGKRRTELLDRARLEIVGHEASSLGYTCKHSRPNLLIIMKGEDKIGPPRASESSMGALFSLYAPTCPPECRQQSARLDGWPSTHAEIPSMHETAHSMSDLVGQNRCLKGPLGFSCLPVNADPRSAWVVYQ